MILHSNNYVIRLSQIALESSLFPKHKILLHDDDGHVNGGGSGCSSSSSSGGGCGSGGCSVVGDGGFGDVDVVDGGGRIFHSPFLRSIVIKLANMKYSWNTSHSGSGTVIDIVVVVAGRRRRRRLRTI